MEKIKEHKEIVIAVAVILGFIFYWIQIRPVTTKRECSWFTEITPADVGVTREQAEANKKAFGEKCDENRSYQGYQGLAPTGGYQGITTPACFLLKNDTVERLPQPEKETTREATKSEYDTCLRHNGM